MAIGSHVSRLAIAAFALAVTSVPALADVKAGVDAWSRGEYDAAVKQWRDPAIKGDPDAHFIGLTQIKLGIGITL